MILENHRYSYCSKLKLYFFIHFHAIMNDREFCRIKRALKFFFMFRPENDSVDDNFFGTNILEKKNWLIPIQWSILNSAFFSKKNSSAKLVFFRSLSWVLLCTSFWSWFVIFAYFYVLPKISCFCLIFIQLTSGLMYLC